MKKRSIYEVLESVAQHKKNEDKVQALREHGSAAIQQLLKYTFDPSIKFLLPKGDAPFKPCPFPDQHSRLYTEVRRLYLFVDGGHTGLSTLKRESLFIQLLESIDPNDAKLVCCVKDKKLPFKGITAKIVNEAFPNLIQSTTNQKEHVANG